MKDAHYLGSSTNNQAEYEALIAALEFAAKVSAEEVVCYLDSELVTKQLNRVYSVKSPQLKKLWLRVHDLAKGFKRVSYNNVPRIHPSIQAADTLVNEVLDKASRRTLT